MTVSVPGNLKPCAIILAAGASSRMGRDKALLPWPPASASSTLLSAAIDRFKPIAPTVLVVAGHNLQALAPVAHAHGAILVPNPAPERGQFSSLLTGLGAAVEHGCTLAMITPVDCPPLSLVSLEKLSQAFLEAEARGIWAIAPENSLRRGHPLVAGRELIDAFLAAPLTENAREVRNRHADRIEYVPVSDPLLAQDMNTPEQYRAAANWVESVSAK